MKNIEEVSFSNIKKHHTQTLQDAIDNKQADEDVVPFLLKITNLKDIFTSSSCSGRVVLLSSDVDENKKYTSFYKRYHRQITFDEILKDIQDFSKGYLWLKVEPFIFHFGVKDIEHAKKVLSFLRDYGLKRAAIISIKPGKVMIEATNTVFLSTLVKKDDHQFISVDHLQEIVKIANNKFKDNEKKRKDFEKKFISFFS